MLIPLVFDQHGTDSTIAPPKKQRFSLTNVSWLLDTKKDTVVEKERCPHIFLCAKRGLSIDDVGVSRDTVFQEIRPGSWF